MAELAELIMKRGRIKGGLTRASRVVRDFVSGGDVQQLKSRIPYLETLFRQFNDVQLEIEKLDSETANGGDQEIFENEYFDTISKISTLLENQTSSACGSSASTGIKGVNSQLNIKLPTLNLPQFTGLYTEWNSFYDTFNSLIHQSDKLNDCERFHYLKSCLKGDPLHAVESLPVSEANYASAWDILKKRYQNKRLIVQEHVYSIIKLQSIVKPSHSSLRQLLDIVTSNIAALKVLGVPVDHWDALIVLLITEKLDYVTKREWQTTLNSTIPKLTELTSFLEKRLEVLRSIDMTGKPHQAGNISGESQNKPYQANKEWHHEPNKFHYQAPRQVAYLTTKKLNCFQCKRASHNIYQCIEFLKLSVPDRLKQVEIHKLCSNCLRNNHSTGECLSERICGECKQRHNTLLHQNTNTLRANELPSSTHNIEPSAPIASNHCRYGTSDTVLLATALIYIKDHTGNYQEIRCVLDVGSQASFISKDMVQTLKLKSKSINIPIVGINQTLSTITQSVNADIKSKHNAFSANIKCLVLPRITHNLPVRSFSMSQIEIPKNIKLADPSFNLSKQVDLLIGADLFWELLCVGQIQTGKNQPVFQKTHFGWIIGGSVNSPRQVAPIHCNLSTKPAVSLDDSLTKFWELEHYPSQKNLSPEDKICENHFKQNYERDYNGHFIIKLPFINQIVNVGSSYNIALKRFYNLEKKLNNNPELKLQYSKFIKEYQELKHMELDSGPIAEASSCYLPHHAVFKESSTTKLRVVFDASAKTTNGLSLNDNLMCGPVVQQDLFSILTRFRTFQYALNGDITKMYRQIKIHPSQVKYQKILWRENTEQPIQTFQLSTLTYGTKPASFIATRCLQELAHQNHSKFPVGSLIVSRDFYMDDLLTGANSINEVIKIRKEVTNILYQAGFELRKFAANDPQILQEVVESNIDKIINLDKEGNTKTLGLLWNCANDEFKFAVKVHKIPNKITKRSIISTVAQIFDPLGLIGPVTMRAKIIIQNLWTLKLGWDESIPTTMHSLWFQFLMELTYLNEVNIDRKIIPINLANGEIELHGFCDASQQGYGAAIYIRWSDAHNNHSCRLLCAKSRVAPLKTITIPKLELCAAVLLVKLVHAVTQTVNLQIKRQLLWTDSTIVLAWLASCPSSLNTFVANRVSEIQALSCVDDWYHVRSEDNPADIISRGLLPKELRKSHLWFHGPQWLSKHRGEQPRLKPDIGNIEVIETRKVILAVNIKVMPELPVITKYSTFSKLQRVISFCLRFLGKCRNKGIPVSKNLSTTELKGATQVIIKIIQRQEFALDLSKLTENQELDKNSKLISLNPFVDGNGLIRVGGRLRNAPITADRKYPIILPKGHYVTKLLITQEHERQLHAGAQATLASLRQFYWVISARSVIRRVIHKCIKCFRVKPHAAMQKMGDLPIDRLQLTRPFLNSGVDYAGPILIKEGRGRGKRNVKGYIAVFVCFATKATHLELVGDLTTDSFLNALKRFIARRGHVSHMHSDNAKNYVGANRELEDLVRFFENKEFQESLNFMLKPLNITWKFIPPRAPNMGGLWEANVKSVKYHMKRIMGNAILTYEEMYTLLTRIEACLNSRPLTPLSSDPNDLAALTPGHFIIGEPLTSITERDITDININRLSRWQYVEQLRQHFWKRWYREYLVQMQQRTKWQQQMKHRLRINDMVVIIEDGVPPQQWPLGRIIQLHPGADKLTRVVTVKTVRGVIKRAVNRVCVLPMDQETDNLIV